jgi:2-polyprenyl-3-methyl-5-hydroxy-6-metoxy-1,4-benzoquinol methylase
MTHPVPTPKELSRLYRAGTYRAPGGQRFPGPIEALVSLSRRRRKARIERFAHPGTLLDVGCGRGLFLHVMRGGGWRAYGTEYDDESAVAARQTYGLDVRTGNLDGAGFPPGFFDVITMSHVLEHLPDPAVSVEQCRRLLRPGGLFVVAVPNLSSLQASVGKRCWFHLDPPHHLFHFTEEGLLALLERARLRVREVRRFDLEYDPFGWLQTLLNRICRSRNALFDRLQQGGKGTAPPPAGDVAASLLLAPILAPASLALSLLDSFLLCRGGTVEIFATAD